MKTAKNEFLKKVKGSLSLFKSKKKPLLFIFIPFFAVFSLSVFTLSSNNKTPISWTPKKIQEEVFVGTIKVIDAQFVSKENLKNVELWITPKLKDCLIVTPNSFNTIEKNKIIQVKIIVSIPLDNSIKSCGGTIHLKSIAKSEETYPQTLNVVLNVKEPTAEEIPEEITLPASDRIAEDPAIGQNYIKDEIIVKFKDGTSETAIKQAVQNIGGVFIGFLKDLEIYQIQVNVADFNELDQKITQLEQNSIVDFAGRQIVTIPSF